MKTRCFVEQFKFSIGNPNKNLYQLTGIIYFFPGGNIWIELPTTETLTVSGACELYRVSKVTRAQPARSHLGAGPPAVIGAPLDSGRPQETLQKSRSSSRRRDSAAASRAAEQAQVAVGHHQRNQQADLGQRKALSRAPERPQNAHITKTQLSSNLTKTDHLIPAVDLVGLRTIDGRNGVLCFVSPDGIRKGGLTPPLQPEDQTAQSDGKTRSIPIPIDLRDEQLSMRGDAASARHVRATPPCSRTQFRLP